MYRLVEYMADATGFHAKNHPSEPRVRTPVAPANRQLPAKLVHRQPSNVQVSLDQQPDMNEWFGRRRYQTQDNNDAAFAYSINSAEPIESYRTAASQVQIIQPQLLTPSAI